METERIIRAVEAASASLRLRARPDRDDLEQDAAVAVIRALSEERTDGYLVVTARNRMVKTMLRFAPLALDTDVEALPIQARIDELGERWRAAVREECEAVPGDDWRRFGGLLTGEEDPAEAGERLGVRAVDARVMANAAARRLAKSKRLKEFYRESI
jgi:hypothetical protein